MNPSLLIFLLNDHSSFNYDNVVVVLDLKSKDGAGQADGKTKSDR